MSVWKRTTVLLLCTSGVVVASAALLQSGRAFAAADVHAMAPANAELKALYWRGHEALQTGDWDAALARFVELEHRLQDSDAASADAALYWQAYALVQSNRVAQARKTVARLHRTFPNSSWGGDADALIGQNADARAQTLGAGNAQAETAIERAISEPAPQAAQSLQAVIDGNYSIRTRKRALFVLSQLGDAASLRRVANVARSSDPELSREAIQMLGVGGASRELREIYEASANPETQRAVLRALGVAGAVSDLAAVAESESDISLRREAIENLGVAGGTERLIALYGTVKTPELRRAVMDALRVSADSKTLLELYDRAETPEQRQALMRIQEEIGNDDRGEK